MFFFFNESKIVRLYFVGGVILLGSFVAMIAAVKRQVTDNSDELQQN